MTAGRDDAPRPRARRGLDPRAVGAVAAIAALPPAGLALASDHFAGEPLLLASTLCAALAVGALAVQPLFAAAGARGRRAHRATGTVIVVLVLLHVALLFVLAPDDALFAMSPDGPTRARMALIATVALLVAAVLGAIGPSSRVSRRTWRVLHAYLALLVVVLGVGHAVLTDGALDGAGTPLLLGLGALGVVGIGAAVAADARRRRPRR
jgi:predicted ferric reductase